MRCSNLILMKPDKRWALRPVNEDVVNRLQDALKINPAMCRILALRGVTDYDNAKLFFRPELSQLHDPFLMKGMRKAVDRITEAIEWHDR
jgi:single-stranded-DNA-specific exonuclease